MKHALILFSLLTIFTTHSASAQDASVTSVMGRLYAANSEMLQNLLFTKSPTVTYDESAKSWTFISLDGTIVEKCYQTGSICSITDSSENPSTKILKADRLTSEVSGHAAAATLAILQALLAANSGTTNYNATYRNWNYGPSAKPTEQNLIVLYSIGCSSLPTSCLVHENEE